MHIYSNDSDEDDYDFVLNVNLKSVYFLSQAAYPLMRDAGGGIFQ